MPVSRFERFARVGSTAGAFALGGLVEGAKRLVGASASTGNIFLNAASATSLAKRLAKMRGAAMKLGQLVSLQGGDLVPPEFAAALALLRESGDTMPVAQLRGVLGREWGAGWEKKFERFDLEPMAAASIGQVHSARTKDGRELAIKIQFPGVAKSIDSDLDSLATLLTVTRVLPVEIDPKGIVAEAKRQLKTEADYVAEAGKLKRYRELAAIAEPECVVPRVHLDLSTMRVLAMDRIEGRAIETLADDGVAQATRDRVGAMLMRVSMRELFEWRFVQTDPNFANFRVTPDDRVVFLDLGGARDYEAVLIGRFRRLLQTLLKTDSDAIHGALIDLEFLARDESPERAAAVVRAVELMAEPLRHRGLYDFGASDLPSRVNVARLDLVLRLRFFRAPPPVTLFLLRKFVGTFFLCAKIRSRVDARRIAQTWATDDGPTRP